MSEDDSWEKDGFGMRYKRHITPEMMAAAHRVMQHGLATPADIWDAMYRAAMGEPLESIEPKVKP